jgi:hypothetical protein
MTQAERSRSVVLSRERALHLIEAEADPHCVWSGRRLDAQSLVIDHCIPRSAWPCDDLRNLMSAHRLVYCTRGCRVSSHTELLTS